ncbi:MAG: hypothetical protein ACXW4T_08815 [Candidatus Limnocylindrales bacterium]
MIRRIAATLVALALPLALSAPVLAGGWAEIVPDAGTITTEPIAGEPMEVGFTVLQHGQTAAGWTTPTVHFSGPATGADVKVAATASGKDGHFVASITPDADGAWSWHVTLAELTTDQAPVSFTVLPAPVGAPVAAEAPSPSIIALSALAGVALLIALIWLARRPRPRLVGAAPREADAA